MNRIILFFYVGTRGSQRIRYVVGGSCYEKLSTDQLGAAYWESVPFQAQGMPPATILLEQALRVTYMIARAPDGFVLKTSNSLWPPGVTLTNDGFEIEIKF